MKNIHKYALVAGALLTSTAMVSPALASHFRGGAMVPSVDANGLLTLTSTTFWRPGAADSLTPTVAGVGPMSFLSDVLDTSDTRFDKRTQVHTIQLSAGGSYDISMDSCCRVAGINNWAGSSSVSWQLDSTIVWDGSTSNTPILFDFSSIQPEVVRGVDYNDGFGATAGNGGTLTYDQALNDIPSQPPGFTVDTSTGDFFIAAADNLGYADNGSGNIGADYAFSGNIHNSDGSSVEYDWLFDAVETAGNRAPNVTNYIINALVGDNISQTVVATDANTGDDVTLSLLSFFGPGVNINAGFAPGAPGNPTDGLFTWNTLGSTPGVYIANIRGTDGALTDTGTVTVNLTIGDDGGPVGVPEPGTLALMATGLLGLGFAARRRKQ